MCFVFNRTRSECRRGKDDVRQGPGDDVTGRGDRHLARAIGVDDPEGIVVGVHHLVAPVQRPAGVTSSAEVHFSATRKRDDDDVGDTSHILHIRELRV